MIHMPTLATAGFMLALTLGEATAQPRPTPALGVESLTAYEQALTTKQYYDVNSRDAAAGARLLGNIVKAAQDDLVAALVAPTYQKAGTTIKKSTSGLANDKNRAELIRGIAANIVGRVGPETEDDKSSFVAVLSDTRQKSPDKLFVETVKSALVLQMRRLEAQAGRK